MKAKRSITLIDVSGREWKFDNASINLMTSNDTLGVTVISQSGSTYYHFCLNNIICYYIFESEEKDNGNQHSNER